jgi:hypothetical protein
VRLVKLWYHIKRPQITRLSVAFSGNNNPPNGWAIGGGGISPGPFKVFCLLE